jgi:pimeloyl-ACP methyl ester carboxylesterase
MAYLDTGDGKNVYYEDYGSGDSAVVLVHGWGMGLRMWDYTLPALIHAGHRVIALDHRGCGRSDKDFADFGIESIAADVVALVGKLGLEKTVLNGWSLGGAVAVSAAATLGSTCTGLFLTCAATPAYLQKPGYPYGGTDEALADTMAAMAADRVNFLAALSQGVCAEGASPDVISWMLRSFLEASPMAAQGLAELGPLDQRELLSNLGMPVISAVGALDQVVDPNVCRSVKDYSSNATIIEFEASGHAPFIEEAGRYNTELLAFCSKCL